MVDTPQTKMSIDKLEEDALFDLEDVNTGRHMSNSDPAIHFICGFGCLRCREAIERMSRGIRNLAAMCRKREKLANGFERAFNVLKDSLADSEKREEMRALERDIFRKQVTESEKRASEAELQHGVFCERAFTKGELKSAARIAALESALAGAHVQNCECGRRLSPNGIERRCLALRKGGSQ